MRYLQDLINQLSGSMPPTQHTALQITRKDDCLSLSGALTIHALADASAKLMEHAPSQPYREIDITGLTALDTAGAYFLNELRRTSPIRCEEEGHRQLIEMVAALDVGTLPKLPEVHPAEAFVVGIGRLAYAGRAEAMRVIGFGGKAVIMLARAIRQPHRLRYGAISQQIHAIGFEALPIIGLMAFLIAIVLAYQGVAQLRPYGGAQFTVNLVALSILREMGVLLTAIMVAGRSGSAFTAEIGVMKAREEIDALQVIGLDPFNMLVVPRLIAIVIALPLLTFYANIMGLVGGFLICHSLIDISLAQYIDRLHEAASGSDMFVGMIKAPIFAFVIGIVGCMHGLRVSGSAESIGNETTAAVVKGIFLVLVLDAFFSIFFEKVGL